MFTSQLPKVRRSDRSVHVGTYWLTEIDKIGTAVTLSFFAV